MDLEKSDETTDLPDELGRIRRFLKSIDVQREEFLTALGFVVTIALLEERDRNELQTRALKEDEIGTLPPLCWPVNQAQVDEGAFFESVNDRMRFSAENNLGTLRWYKHIDDCGHPIEGLALKLAIVAVSKCFGSTDKTISQTVKPYWRAVLTCLGGDYSSSGYASVTPWERIKRPLFVGDHPFLLMDFTDRLSMGPDVPCENETMEHHDLVVVVSGGPQASCSIAVLVSSGMDNIMFVLGIDRCSEGEFFDYAIITKIKDIPQNRIREGLPVPTGRAFHSVLQRTLIKLKSEGIAMVLAPSNFLTGGSDHKRVRLWVTNKFRISYVLVGGGSPSTRRRGPGDLVVLRHDLSIPITGQRPAFCQPPYFRSDAGSYANEILPILGCWAIACTPNESLKSLAQSSVEDLLANLGRFWFQVGEQAKAMRIVEEIWRYIQRLLKNPLLIKPPSIPETINEIAENSLAWVDQADFTRGPAKWRVAGDVLATVRLRRDFEALAHNNSELQVSDLGELAKIFEGTTCEGFDLYDTQSLSSDECSSFIGVVRARDLPSQDQRELKGYLPFARRPEVCVPVSDAADLRSYIKLRQWDILVSTSGKVGRVAVFDADSMAGLACIPSSQIAIIRPHESFDINTIRYLVGILISGSGQRWLNSHCAENFGGRLITSVASLRFMPLIKGPINVLSVIGRHLLQGLPLETSMDVFEKSVSTDPTVRILLESQAVQRAAMADSELPTPEKLQLLRDVSSAVTAWEKQYDSVWQRGLLALWWSEWLDAFSRAQEAMEIHPAGRLSALLFWKLSFSALRLRLVEECQSDEALSESVTSDDSDSLQIETLKSHGPRLIRCLETTVEKEIETLCSDIHVTAALSPDSIQKGVSSILTARIESRSQLSLCGFKVIIEGAMLGPIELKPQVPVELAFSFAALECGIHPVAIGWTAKRLDGSTIEGEVMATINVVKDLHADKVEGIGINPYVDARTLQDDEDRVFFGRKPEIARILAELRKPSASTVLLIEGNRRTGKTSLIHHFLKHHLPDAWVAAYCTFQSGEGEVDPSGTTGRGIPTREVFFILAKAVVEGVVRSGINLELEGIGAFDPEWRPALLFRRVSLMLRPYFESGPPYERLRLVLDQCLEALGSRRLLLIIDEFDRLQEGIDSGVTSDQVPENIRHLFQTYNQMAGILTGSRKIRRLREEYWNVLFGIGDPVILRGLELEAVRDLIVKPVEGRLTYVPGAVEAISHLTAGQPRIIQTLCSRLFDLCEQQGSPIVTEAMVDEVAAEKACDYEHFKVVWSAIQSSVDQFVALTVNRMAFETTLPVSFSLLQDELEVQGVRLNQKRLGVSLENLRDLEVIGEKITDSTKCYFIEIPLLSRWLLQNQDQGRLREAAQEEIL